MDYSLTTRVLLFMCKFSEWCITEERILSLVKEIEDLLKAFSFGAICKGAKITGFGGIGLARLFKVGPFKKEGIIPEENKLNN